MSEEERKKDDLADALAALAAGEHPDEPVEGSGIDAHTHLEGVGETPSPPRTPAAGPVSPSAARPSGAPRPSTTLRPASPHSKARPAAPDQAPPPARSPAVRSEEFVRPERSPEEIAAAHDAEVSAEADAIA